MMWKGLAIWAFVLSNSQTVAAPGDPASARKAVLVEIQMTPRCVGLDCPPWPVPDDVDFCFEANGEFYTGVYRPWGFPRGTNSKRLQEYKGKEVTLNISETRITVVTPHFKLHLRRVRDDLVFNLAGCRHN